eukprot:jgi/Tetstr1/427935/TSEL_018010.t1
MFDNDGALTEEKNFWVFNSNTYPWRDIADVGESAYGGYLSFDVITLSEFHFVAQRKPLLEVDGPRLIDMGKAAEYFDPCGLDNIRVWRPFPLAATSTIATEASLPTEAEGVQADLTLVEEPGYDFSSCLQVWPGAIARVSVTELPPDTLPAGTVPQIELQAFDGQDTPVFVDADRDAIVIEVQAVNGTIISLPVESTWSADGDSFQTLVTLDRVTEAGTFMVEVRVQRSLGRCELQGRFQFRFVGPTGSPLPRSSKDEGIYDLRLSPSNNDTALLQGRSWTVEIVPGAVDWSRTVVSGLPSNLTAGDSLELSVQLQDTFGNGIDAASVPQQTFYMGLDCQACEGVGHAETLGVLGTAFTLSVANLTTAGPYALVWRPLPDSGTDGAVLLGSTEVLPAPWQPAFIVISGAPFGSIRAGGTISLQLEAQDMYGNIASNSVPSLSALLDPATFWPPPPAGVVPPICTVLDGTPALAEVSCAMTAAGAYELRLSADGLPLGGNLSVSVRPGTPSAAASTIEGPALLGGRAGQENLVTLTTRDAYGNLNSGEPELEFAFLPAGEVTGTGSMVTDHGNGTFTLGVEVRRFAGASSAPQLAIKMNDAALPGSPWTPNWAAGLPASPTASAFLPAPGLFRSAAGVSVQVGVVALVDEHGNPAAGLEHAALLTGMAETTQGDTLNAALNPVVAPVGSPLTFVPADNDTFSVMFLAEVAAEYDMSVSYNDEPIGTPSNSTITGWQVSGAGGDHNASLLWTCEPSVDLAASGPLAAGTHINVTVSQLDPFGNRYWAGGNLSAALQQVDVDAEGVELLPLLAGEYIGQVVVPLRVTAASPAGSPLAVRLFAPALPAEQSPLCGGPIMLEVVPSPASSAGSQLTGAALEGSIPAGSDARLTLVVRDAWGNAVPVDAADVGVLLTPLFGNSTVASLPGATFTGNQPGEVQLAFAAAQAGRWRLDVTLSGEPFGEALEVEVAPGPQDLSSATVSVTPPVATILEAGEQLRLAALASDAFGNPRPGDTLDLELRIAVAPPEYRQPSVTQNDTEDGGAELAVSFFTAGSYHWTLWANNATQILAGTTQVAAGPLSTEQSWYEAPAQVVAGEQAELLLYARDEHGNTADATGAIGLLRLAASSPTLRPIFYGLQGFPEGGAGEGTLAAEPSGWDPSRQAYTFAFTAMVAGTYDVTVRSAPGPDGEALDGQPKTVHVAPAALDAAASVLLLDSPLAGAAFEAGQVITVWVRAVDRFGNLLVASDAVAQLALPALQPSVSEADVSLEEVAGTEAVAAVRLRIYAVGVYRLDVTDLAGSQLAGSPLQGLTVTASAPSAATSTPTGAGLSSAENGQWNDIHLLLRDEFGNPLAPGDAARVEWAITGPAEAEMEPPAQLEMADDGSLRGRYRTELPGDYNVTITLDGQPLPGSPFQVEVGVGSVVPAMSEATVLGGATTAEDAITVAVTARDAAGAPITDPNVNFTVAVMLIPPDGGAPQLVGIYTATLDPESGLYTVDIPPGLAGSLSLTVLYEGSAVGGNGEDGQAAPPLLSVTREPAEPALDGFHLAGSLLANFTAGSPLHLDVEARDRFGNAVPLNETGALVVSWRSGRRAEARTATADMMDGVARLDLQIDAAGALELNATFMGDHLPGSPFTLTATPGAASAATTTFEVWPQEVAAGETLVADLRLRDTFGNTVGEGSPALAVRGSPGSGSQALPPPSTLVFDPATNGFTASWTPTLAGEFLLVATLPLLPQANWTASVVVLAGPASAEASQLDAALTASSTVAGEPAPVVVLLRDIYGNPATSLDGLQLAVEVDGSMLGGDMLAWAEMPEGGDGAWQLTLNLTTASPGAEVSVQLNGTAVLGGNYTLPVLPGAFSAAQSVVSAPGVVRAGDPLQIAIYPRDAFGNPIPELPAGSGTLSVEFQQRSVLLPGSDWISAGSAPARQAEVGGPYTAELAFYSAQAEMRAAVVYRSAAAGGSDPELPLYLPGGAIQFEVVASLEALPGMAVVALLPSNITAGDNATVAVYSRDAYGNPTPLPAGETFEVALVPLTEEPLDAGDSGLTWTQAVRDEGLPLVGNSQTAQGYSVVRQVTLAGSYQVLVRLQNATGAFTPIVAPGDTPRIVQVQAAAASAISTVTLTSPPQITAGDSLQLSVQAVDEYSNQVPTGGASFQAALLYNGNPAEPATTVQLLDAQDGQYRLTLQLTRAGSVTVTVVLDGAAVQSMPLLVTVTPSNLSLSESELSGSLLALGGLTAGEVVEAAFTPLDEFRNSAPEGLEFSLCIISGESKELLAVPERLCVEMLPQGGGLPLASGPINMTLAGSFYLLVVDDTMAPASAPQSVEVLPGPPSRSHALLRTAAGGSEPLQAEYAVEAGLPLQLLVGMRDRYGNTVPLATALEGTPPVATVTEAGSVLAAAQRRRLHTTGGSVEAAVVEGEGGPWLSLTLQLTSAGTYSVSVEKLALLEGWDPLLLAVVHPAALDAASTHVDGSLHTDLLPPFAALTALAGGGPVEVQLQLRDVFGNPIASDIASLRVRVTSEALGGLEAPVEMVPVQVLESNDGGGHTLRLQASIAGEYSVAIDVCPAPVDGESVECLQGAVPGLGAPLPAKLLVLPMVPVEVLSIEPQTGPQAGATAVTITGRNFYPSSTIRCRFGPEWTPGSFQLEHPSAPPGSDNPVTALICPTPEVPSSGAVGMSLELSPWMESAAAALAAGGGEGEGEFFGRVEMPGQLFTFTPAGATVVASVSPVWLDASAPGQLVLSGTALGFDARDVPACRVTVAPGGEMITVDADVDAAFATATCGPLPPLPVGGAVAIAFAPNGQDFIDTGFQVAIEDDFAPEALDDFADVQLDAAVDIDVLLNDAVAKYGKFLMPGLVQQPSFGSAEIVEREGQAALRYTPGALFELEDTLVYEMQDALSRSTTAAVHLRLAPEPPTLHAPVAPWLGVEGTELLLPMFTVDFNSPRVELRAVLSPQGGAILVRLPAVGEVAGASPVMTPAAEGKCHLTFGPAETQLDDHQQGQGISEAGAAMCAELTANGTVAQLGALLGNLSFLGDSHHNGVVKVAVQVCSPFNLCAEATKSGWLAAVNDAPSISVSAIKHSSGTTPCTDTRSGKALPGVVLALHMDDPDAADWRAGATGASPLALRVLLLLAGGQLHLLSAPADLRAGIAALHPENVTVPNIKGAAISKYQGSASQTQPLTQPQLLPTSGSDLRAFFPGAPSSALDPGTGGHVLVLEGSLAGLNTAMKQVACCLMEGNEGDEELQVLVSDLGNYGEESVTWDKQETSLLEIQRNGTGELDFPGNGTTTEDSPPLMVFQAILLASQIRTASSGGSSVVLPAVLGVVFFIVLVLICAAGILWLLRRRRSGAPDSHASSDGASDVPKRWRNIWGVFSSMPFSPSRPTSNSGTKTGASRISVALQEKMLGHGSKRGTGGVLQIRGCSRCFGGYLRSLGPFGLSEQQLQLARDCHLREPGHRR